MALHGGSSGVFVIKSLADKFFRFIVEDTSNPDTRPLKMIKKCLTQVDREKKTLTIGLSGPQLSEIYKTITITIKVTPKEDEAEGSHITWTFEFEKIRHDIEDPYSVTDLIRTYLEEIDEKLKS